MTKEKNSETLSINDTLKIWEKVTGQPSYASADDIQKGLYASVDLYAEDGGSATLRLSFRRDTGDWCVYANDMGRGDKTESSVSLIADVVRKLKLEGINIGFVNVQGAYDNSKELKEMIDRELGE